MIGEVVLGRLLQLVEVVLMVDVACSTAFDAFRAMFLSSAPLVIDQERLHLWPQSDELSDGLAARLVLELTDNLEAHENAHVYVHGH